MRIFYIESGWKSGLVIARNEIHSIHIATKTGLHKTGNWIVCLPVDQRTLDFEIASMVELGSGRILLPSLFRRKPMLIMCE